MTIKPTAVSDAGFAYGRLKERALKGDKEAQVECERIEAIGEGVEFSQEFWDHLDARIARETEEMRIEMEREEDG